LSSVAMPSIIPNVSFHCRPPFFYTELDPTLLCTYTEGVCRKVIVDRKVKNFLPVLPEYSLFKE